MDFLIVKQQIHLGIFSIHKPLQVMIETNQFIKFYTQQIIKMIDIKWILFKQGINGIHQITSFYVLEKHHTEFILAIVRAIKMISNLSKISINFFLILDKQHEQYERNGYSRIKLGSLIKDDHEFEMLQGNSNIHLQHCPNTFNKMDKNSLMQKHENFKQNKDEMYNQPFSCKQNTKNHKRIMNLINLSCDFKIQERIKFDDEKRIDQFYVNPVTGLNEQ